LIALISLKFTDASEFSQPYQGFSVKSVEIVHPKALSLLRDATNPRQSGNKIELWGEASPQFGTNYLLVPPDVDVSSFLGVKSEHIQDVIADLGVVIEQERLHALQHKWNTVSLNKMDDFFSSYHDLSDINAYIAQLVSAYPKLASTFTLGTTYEGRIQTGIMIGTAGKPVIFYEGGVHAREWISPATMCYIAMNLLKNYDAGGDKSTKFLLDNLQFIILPVTNPDGYAYTWSTQRLWRKNRAPTGIFENGSQCIGIDLNRNWNYSFSSDDPHPDPCSESYPGAAPFSQPEIAALTTMVAKIQSQQPIYLYIDWHSCGELWMYPWAWSSNKAPDSSKQNNLGEIAVEAIFNTHGENYTLGPIAQTIYEVGGSSVDWIYDVLDIVYAYGVELRDTGKYCFVLPPNQIIPTAEENYAATVAMATFLLKNPPCAV